MNLGMRCLGSLVRMSQEKIHLIIHDDGTLRAEDITTLQSALPCSVILREEADALIIPQLSNYKACLEYRQKHVLALKLFDISLLETDTLAYCDTDILFLKPFSGLFDLDKFAADAVFMQDCREAYTLRPWHVWPLGPVKISAKTNTGLICFNPKKFDLDRVNYFLGRYGNEEVFIKHSAWIEQTTWAVASSALRCKVYNPENFIIATPGNRSLFEQAIGIHFVSLFRKLFIDEVKEPDTEQLNFLPLQPVNVQNPKRATSYSIFKSAVLARMGKEG
jgi:hypothetical protein